MGKSNLDARVTVRLKSEIYGVLHGMATEYGVAVSVVARSLIGEAVSRRISAAGKTEDRPRKFVSDIAKRLLSEPGLLERLAFFGGQGAFDDQEEADAGE